MEKYESLGLMCAVALFLLFAWAILAPIARWFASLFDGEKQGVIPAEEELEIALKIAATPRPVFGTKQWMHYECKPVFCDAPSAPIAAFDGIHFPTDPTHLASCPRCQAEVRAQRRMPHPN